MTGAAPATCAAFPDLSGRGGRIDRQSLIRVLTQETYVDEAAHIAT